MKMLSSIPNEIIILILEKLSPRDLYAICQLSRNLCDLALPLLYRVVIIWFDANQEILPRFKSLLSGGRERFKVTKRAEFRFPHFSDMRATCPYRPNEIGIDEDALTPVGKEIIPYLERFEANGLREFTFFLCMCTLPNLFNESGFMTRHQRNLTQLNIYTAIADGFFQWDQMDLTFMRFPNLQSFTYRQAMYKADFKRIRRMINAKSGDLHSIDLEIAPLAELNPDIGEGNALVECGFFDDDVFEAHNDVSFPSLRNLSLANTSFTPASLTVAQGLNIEGLKRLTLWNCHGIMDLFDVVVKHGLKVQLTHLDIVRGVHLVDMIEELDFWKSLAKFLASFGGLVELCLLIPGPSSWETICCSIKRLHSKTLRRLVLHERERTLHTGFQDTADRSFEWSQSLAETICEPQLDFFGVSSTFKSLTDVFSKKIKSKPGIKVLHVRKSRRDIYQAMQFAEQASNDSKSDHIMPDAEPQEDPAYTRSASLEDPDQDITPEFKPLGIELFDLASTVFGEDGLPNLQILAYGDFSLHGQQWDKNIVLCRNDKHKPKAKPTRGFKMLKDSDILMNDLLQDNMRMLGACVLEGVRPDAESTFKI